MLALLGVFILLSTTTGHGQAVTFPRNTAVIQGQRMEMECRIDDRSIFRTWTMLRLCDEMEQTIFQAGDSETSFEQLGVEAGSLVLYSNSTSLDDAGAYRCVIQSKKTHQLDTYSAQLIVFESNPYCEINNLMENGTLRKGDLVWLFCRVRFKGNWIPTMEWRLENEGRLETSMLEDVNTTRINEVLISTVRIFVDSSISDPVRFTCRTYFSPVSNVTKDTTKAINVPEFEYVWVSPVIRLYSPPPPTSTETTIHVTKEDDLPTSAVASSFENQLLQSLTENWVIIALVGIIICFIVTAAISFCVCSRARNRAAASRPRAVYRPESLASATSPAGETYEAIDDAIEYSEIAPSSPSYLAARSMSSPDGTATARRLPARPPVNIPNKIQNSQEPKRSSKKGKTMERGRGNMSIREIEALESVKSSSLPNLYSESTNGSRSACQIPQYTELPVYDNQTYYAESTAYLAANEVSVDESADKIPSTYLEVNELSKRDNNKHRQLDLQDFYLTPKLI